MKKLVFDRGSQAGHTLIEIMFSIAIIGILSSMAFPSVTTTMNNASIKSTRQILLQDIRLLRSHARTQHTAAYLCARSPEGNCVRQLNWNNGWLGFMDNNQSRIFDEGDEVVLEHRPSTLRNINIIIHSRWKNIKIDQQGIIRSSGHFRICDPAKTGTQKMHVIRMNVHGRLNIDPDTLDCA